MNATFNSTTFNINASQSSDDRSFTAYTETEAAKRANEAADRANEAADSIIEMAESGAFGVPSIKQDDEGKALIVKDGKASWEQTSSSFSSIGNGLKVTNGVLEVNMAPGVIEDNTLPISSADVYKTVGNIEAILGTV